MKTLILLFLISNSIFAKIVTLPKSSGTLINETDIATNQIELKLTIYKMERVGPLIGFNAGAMSPIPHKEFIIYPKIDGSFVIPKIRFSNHKDYYLGLNAHGPVKIWSEHQYVIDDPEYFPISLLSPLCKRQQISLPSHSYQELIIYYDGEKFVLEN